MNSSSPHSDSAKTVSLGVVGTGVVGSELLSQLVKQQMQLKISLHVHIVVSGIARSQLMLLGDNICLRTWREEFKSKPSKTQPTDLKSFASHVLRNSAAIPVICDCTASDVVPSFYVEWLKMDINVVTANKRPNSGHASLYRAIRDAEDRGRACFRYEANVGAGLPIISTLRDLVHTGDSFIEIEGVLSGTLSYIFNEFDGSEPFSTIVRRAKDSGYTEPDPREDLSGMDVARKIVILAREIGVETELHDLQITNLVPESLRGADVSISSFMDGLEISDSKLTAMAQAAVAENKKLLYVGFIDANTGKCGVELRSYPSSHPFGGLNGTDNIVTLRTSRYDAQPLIVQGPGAGASVTATGLFADILKITTRI